MQRSELRGGGRRRGCVFSLVSKRDSFSLSVPCSRGIGAQGRLEGGKREGGPR